jgi:hypothetical protein
VFKLTSVPVLSDIVVTFVQLNRSDNWKMGNFWVVPILYSVSDIFTGESHFSVVGRVRLTHDDTR